MIYRGHPRTRADGVQKAHEVKGFFFVALELLCATMLKFDIVLQLEVLMNGSWFWIAACGGCILNIQR